MRRARTRDRGLTLLELLAALAVLAVVSVMAVQTLGGTLFQRDILGRVDDDGRALIRALALLRQDLEAVVPLVEGGDGGAQTPVLTAERRGFSLARGGVSGDGGFAVVSWALDPQGRLTRQVTPASGADAGPAVTILEDVRSLELIARGGALPDADTPTFLPPGFEVTLTHARHGTLRLVVAR